MSKIIQKMVRERMQRMTEQLDEDLLSETCDTLGIDLTEARARIRDLVARDQAEIKPYRDLLREAHQVLFDDHDHERAAVLVALAREVREGPGMLDGDKPVALEWSLVEPGHWRAECDGVRVDIGGHGNRWHAVLTNPGATVCQSVSTGETIRDAVRGMIDIDPARIPRRLMPLLTDDLPA
jgi:ElaB/YqjD/DUF883 family membrane-anchored ribosome-binding protein